MRAVALPFSAVSLPRDPLHNFHHRYVYVQTVASSQLWPSTRRSLSSNSRIPSFNGTAIESGNAQSTVPTSVPVRVAHELLQAGHHYLDVRTPDEFSAGHVVGAINVPYLLKVGQGMTRNPGFLEEVSARFRKDDEIIVGCQLGKRSLMAASELLSAGFTGVTDMAGGYAAWTQNALPSE